MAPSLLGQSYRLVLWYKYDYENCLLKSLEGNREYFFGSHYMSKGVQYCQKTQMSKTVSRTKIQTEVLRVPTSLSGTQPPSLLRALLTCIQVTLSTSCPWKPSSGSQAKFIFPGPPQLHPAGLSTWLPLLLVHQPGH